MPEHLRKSSLILSFLLCMVLTGCSRTHYKKSADKEVYGIIETKSTGLDGMPSAFTIEGEEETLPCEEAGAAPIVLSLQDALKIAVNQSREYQTQKERLYSQGLSLTLARYEFAPILFGTAAGEVERNNRRTSVASVLSFGVSKMLATGGDFAVAITTDLFRYISGGDPAKVATSTIAVSLFQPLLKGAGRKVALENLTQEERDMVYAIRDFVRFRKTLSVEIAKSYYNILQQNDQLTNAWNNYQNLRVERERAELMAKAGRLPEFQVDQTEQDELRARDRWIRAKETYENLLDEFKIDLAIPTDVNVELYLAELEKLADKGVVPPEVSVEEAILIAIQERLDLKNVAGVVEDARRKVDVAANALKPGLDFTSSMNIGTDGQTRPFDFDAEDGSYAAGLELELPLDRKAERNAYRQALINVEAAERALGESVDRIKQEVRNALRNIDQAEQSYNIQLNSLKLAERRVESTALLLQAGRASTRDVLEAREALLEAQDSVSRALVDHFNARLDLFLAMETLRIDDNGLWTEENDVRPNEQND